MDKKEAEELKVNYLIKRKMAGMQKQKNKNKKFLNMLKAI